MGAEAVKVEPGVDPAARNDDARADFVVIGGGPAGLTAAYELAKASRPARSSSRSSTSSAAWPAPRTTRASTSTWAATASSPRPRR